MHIDEFHMRGLHNREKNRVLVYFYTRNTTFVDQQEAKTLPQTPQSNRIRAGSGASSLNTTLDNLAWTCIVEQEVPGTFWIDIEPKELKQEIVQDCSHFQFRESTAERSDFEVLTSQQCFLLIFIQAFYKAYINEKKMLLAFSNKAKFLVPKVQHKPLDLLQQRRGKLCQVTTLN